jgi:serine/threonine protein kinase
MNPEQWEKIQSVLSAAFLLPESEREGFVRAQLAGDSALAQEALELLRAGPHSSGFLKPPDPEMLAERLREFQDRLAGRRIGDFELQTIIGWGAMGVVYRALQLPLKRVVAVKLLPPWLPHSELTIERFRREAIAASKLTHPGIARVISFGEEGDLRYYAMDFVEGQSLQTLLDLARHQPEQHPWPSAQQVAEWAAKLADALHYAHSQGIVHRDVKPSNILIDRQGEPRLIDFGLAIDGDLGRLTKSGSTIGTPQYMSPEQASALDRVIDGRSDIYSLGAVLYELLSKQPPFSADNQPELLRKIVEVHPTAVRRLRPEVSPGLENICQVALEKLPSDRFPDAAQFAADLRRVLAGRSPLTRPPRLWQRAQRRLIRHRWPIAAGFVLLAGASGFGHHLNTRHDPRLTITCPSADGPARVYAHRYDERTGQLIDRKYLGRTPLKAVRVEPGSSLVVVELPDGRFSTQAVYGLTNNQSRTVELHPEQAGRFDADLTRIAAARVSVIRQCIPEGVETHGPIDIPEFLIGKYPVTNGDYMEFLKQHPGVGQRPFFWPEEDSAAWRDRPADFDRRPVTGVRYVDAQAYCSARGQRLPSLEEWRLAVQTTDGRRFPWGEDATRVFAETPMQSAETAPSGSEATGQAPEAAADASAPGGSQSNAQLWRDYLQHVLPVDRRERNFPVGEVYDGYGHIWQMTSSPALMQAGPGTPAQPHGDFYYAAGASWRLAVQGINPASDGLNSVSLSSLSVPDHTIGFRCARDVLPPRPSP